MSNKSYSYDKNKWFMVVCRTCGQGWLYPLAYKNCFDKDKPLENCSFCNKPKKYKTNNGMEIEVMTK